MEELIDAFSGGYEQRTRMKKPRNSLEGIQALLTKSIQSLNLWLARPLCEGFACVGKGTAGD